MRKVSGTGIAAALALFCCIGMVPCAYGHSLVFGPELFFSETGKTQRIVKSFSVDDVSQKFFISIQSKAGGEPEAGCGTITVNGKPIFAVDEMGGKYKMLTKPIQLQKQNQISVDVSGEITAPVIVTIMSLKEQTVTAKVPPIGKAVDLDGYASVVFPAGTFQDTREVRISVAASPAVRDIFQTGAAGPRLPYEIRINSGGKAPEKDIEVSVKYPDSFFASLYQIHVFAHMYENPDEPDMHDKFFLLSSGLDDKLNMAMTTLPRQAFSTRHGRKGTYEAIITVGLIH